MTQPASIDTIKEELQQRPPKEILHLLLQLARFKKENKELLTYLLFESADKAAYIKQIKTDIRDQLTHIDGLSAYLYKKQFRKIQRRLNKSLQYMHDKPAMAELYLHVIALVQENKQTHFVRAFLDKITDQYTMKIEKLLPALEEDLASDIRRQLLQIA